MLTALVDKCLQLLVTVLLREGNHFPGQFATKLTSPTLADHLGRFFELPVLGLLTTSTKLKHPIELSTDVVRVLEPFDGNFKRLVIHRSVLRDMDGLTQHSIMHRNKYSCGLQLDS